MISFESKRFAALILYDIVPIAESEYPLKNRVYSECSDMKKNKHPATETREMSHNYINCLLLVFAPDAGVHRPSHSRKCCFTSNFRLVRRGMKVRNQVSRALRES